MKTDQTTPVLTNGTKSTKKNGRNIPYADTDFLTLAQSVAAKWKTDADFKLKWTDSSTFKTLVDSYDKNLDNKLSTSSGRSIQTQTLAQINKQIDEAVENVKAYIIKKFKKANAPAYFINYGIVKENSSYRLPKDHDKRLKALPLMIAAIAADGFKAEEYGTSFWTTIKNDFTIALNNTITTTKNISNKVAVKNSDREKIHKVLIAIRHLIYAHYPDTYKQVSREWGFIKENF